MRHALQAERFVESLKVEDPEGAVWRQTTDEASDTPRNLYYGSGGIAIFYLELYRATSDKRFLDTAIRAGEGVLASMTDDGPHRISMSSGLAGDVFVLTELYKHTKDERFAEGVRQTLNKLKSTAIPLGAGVGWIEKNPYEAYSARNTNVGEMYDLSIGAAGVGVAFLYAYREGIDDEGLQWATRIAERLLEVGEETDDGLRWPMMDNLPASYIMPNFSHGPAGVAYFLAGLHRETDKQAYLDAALSGARYVQSRAVPKGDGVLVIHHEPEPADLFYLGYCHGPAGTGRLMYLLNEITGDRKWSDWMEKNMAGLLETGAPEKRSDGLWENYSQCCGDAGLGDYALYLYRSTGNALYLDLARRIAGYVLSQAKSENGGLSWEQAEMRIRSEMLHTQSGYMQGAAGIGSFFLHLVTVEDKPVKIPLMATPFE